MAIDSFEDNMQDQGEIFTFGKNCFLDGDPGRFWIRNDPILQVACGDQHTALLTANGHVFTFGSNEWGQLGHGNTTPSTKPTLVQGLEAMRATVIACGRSHTLVATDRGLLYGFGCNSDNQLGSLSEGSSCSEPTCIQGLQGVNVKMLAAGAEHSLALTDRDLVYAWGGNGEGQLGLGERPNCVAPTELKMDATAICIASGYYHSAIITREGKLLTFGEREGGGRKLGLSHHLLKKSCRPQLVSGIPEKLIWVSCGGQHTVAVTVDGKVYSFGDGSSGQLGLGPEILECRLPQPVKVLQGVRVARVACGESHTAFLAEGGHLYTCGDGRHAKLGLVDQLSTSNQFLPQPTDDSFHGMTVQQVACGGCHMVVLAEKLTSSTSGQRNHSPSRVLDSPQQPGAREARARRRQRDLPLSLSTLELNGNSPSHAVKKSLLPNNKKAESGEMVCMNQKKRRSLLQQAEEDVSIRHADSDVESEFSDNSNKSASSERRDKDSEELTTLLRPARLASGELLSPLLPLDQEELTTAQVDVFGSAATITVDDGPRPEALKEVVGGDSCEQSPKKSVDGTPNKTPSRLSRLFNFQRRKSLTRQEKSQSEFYDDEVQAICSHQGDITLKMSDEEVEIKTMEKQCSPSKSTPKKNTPAAESKVPAK